MLLWKVSDPKADELTVTRCETERVLVAKSFDELRLGVKGQSNRHIAGSSRNLCKQGRRKRGRGDRETLSTTKERWNETWHEKVLRREGNSPECMLKPWRV